MKLSLLAPLLCVVAGCASHAIDAEDSDQTEGALIGGIPAKSVKFNAIGSLYGVRPTGSAPICTGTLIGPHTVLTAGHCVHPKGAPFNIIDRYPVFFAIGADSSKPTKTIRAIWGAESPVADADIGIYQLEEDADAAPIPVATQALTASDVGTPLTMVGYGLHDFTENYNQFLTRRSARFALTSFDPSPAHAFFPDFNVFKSFMEANAGHTFVDAAVKVVYDDVIVHPGDAYFGSPTSAQQMYLDSGSPYVMPDGAGGLRVHAVHARSYNADPTVPATGTAKDILPIGGAGALVTTTGVAEFIAQTLTDPCRNVSAGGHCSATSAIRCGNELSTPVVARVDCADFGSVCKVDADGIAACVDP